MTGKIQIDPAHPVGSLTAGNQQFTIVSDTGHEKNSIRSVLNNDLDVAARNGVKKILLEFPINSMEELEKKYPELAEAKTFDERQKVLDNQLKKIDAQDLESLQRGEDISRTPRMELGQARESLRMHDFLERFYADPPQVSADEVSQVSKKYISDLVSDVDAPAAAKDFTTLLEKTRENGIKIVLTGDWQNEAAIDNDIAQTKLDLYMSRHPEMTALFMAQMQDPTVKIPDKDAAAYNKFSEELIDLAKERNIAQRNVHGLRLTDEIEGDRADRFIKAANGDKSLVVWGEGHVSKTNDLNEQLDARLKEQARLAGKPAPSPTRVIEVHDSKEYAAKWLPYSDYPRGYEEPDARYYAREKSLEITPSGASAVEAKARDPQANPVMESVAEQYEKLMGSGIIGSVKSGPSSSSLQTETPVPLRPVVSNPSFSG